MPYFEWTLIGAAESHIGLAFQIPLTGWEEFA